MESLLARRPDLGREQLDRTRRLMDRAMPDAFVEGYGHLVPTLVLPDLGDMIVGGGVFAHASIMPLPLAWEAFGEANGAAASSRCALASSATGATRRPARHRLPHSHPAVLPAGASVNQAAGLVGAQ